MKHVSKSPKVFGMFLKFRANLKNQSSDFFLSQKQ